MRNWITFLMTLLASSASYLNANSTEINFEAGYRRDDLSFSIQTPSCDPVFKTSAKFDEVDIFQLGVRGKTTLGCNFYGRASFSAGWILDGDFEDDVQLVLSDTDVICDRSDVFQFKTTAENIIDGRFVLDFDIAIGYPFYFCDCTMYIAPVVGYAFNEQNFEVESNEHFSFDFTDTTDFFGSCGDSCCTNKFVSEWYGPFIGVDFSYRPCNECWGIFAELEYHYARHKVKRNEFSGVSFFNDLNSTSKHAHGWVVRVGADYEFCGCWTAGLDVKVQDWSSTRSHDFCFDESSSDCSSSGFFGSDDSYKSHSKWRSLAVNVIVGRVF